MSSRCHFSAAFVLATSLCLAPACSSESAVYQGVDAGLGSVDGGAGTSDASGGLVDAGRVDAATGLAPCTVPGPAIVTDIDATLTTSDAEWLTQMAWGSHEPAERPGGADLIRGYAERGYYILYLTARPENYLLAFTMEPTPDATLRWLEEHGYPVDPARTQLVLAPQIIIDATATTDYKTGALQDLEAEGFTFAYAYGNAATDIAAYENAGIAKDHTFIIGAEGGTEDTVAISGDGWSEHVADYLPSVGPVCEP